MTAATTETTAERRIPMTYDGWRDWASETRLSEWVDGEAIEFVPPTVRHQVVVGFLLTMLRLFARPRGLGEVVKSPIEVRLSNRSSREPDIVFVSTARLGIVERLRIDGAPDLLVEVISDDSTRRDRVTKRDEYAAAGVREYWILDPRPGKEREEFLLLDPAWLRADPLPLETDCLAAIDPALLLNGGNRRDGA